VAAAAVGASAGAAVAGEELAITSGHFAAGGEGVRIHYAECRPLNQAEEKGTVMLLHGFPDYHGSWLVEQVSATGRLSMLVGHDWGAFVAWAAAAEYPQLFERLAILNVPHPTRFAEGLLTWQQLSKSWYIFAFQTPLLPETILELSDFALLRRMLSTDPDAPMPPEVIEEHVRAFAANPGAMAAAVNYYRAGGRGLWSGMGSAAVGAMQVALRALTRTPEPRQRQSERGHIVIPVQVLWGERDRYLGRELAEPPREVVPNQRPTRFLDATHWVHWDRPHEVNEELLALLQAETNLP